MTSLQFRNQPLVEAVCSLVFAEPITIDFDVVASLREAVRPHVTLLAEVIVPGTSAPFRFAVGEPVGAKIANPETGVELALQQKQLTVRWLSGGGLAYVRFEALFQLLKLSHGAVGSPAVDLTNMMYVNRFDAKEYSLTKMIRPEWYPPRVANADVYDLNLSFRLESGEDFRLQAGPLGPESFIATASGLRVEGDWADTLTRVHDRMQDVFLDLISEEAKTKWQLQPL